MQYLDSFFIQLLGILKMVQNVADTLTGVNSYPIRIHTHQIILVTDLNLLKWYHLYLCLLEYTLQFLFMGIGDQYYFEVAVVASESSEAS